MGAFAPWRADLPKMRKLAAFLLNPGAFSFGTKEKEPCDRRDLNPDFEIGNLVS